MDTILVKIDLSNDFVLIDVHSWLNNKGDVEPLMNTNGH